MNNIVINRVWDNKADDDNDSSSSSSSDNNSDNAVPNLDATPDVNVTSSVDENSTSNQPANSFSGAGDDYCVFDISQLELTPLPDSPLTKMSSSFMMIIDQPLTPCPRPYGVIIDYGSSFSLNDINEFGYQINSVRQTIQFYSCHLTFC